MYLLGEVSKLQTPKGIDAVGGVGLNMSRYYKNYKGGRNESFMYGSDTKVYWYDYDLTAAYTSVMSQAGDPDYEKARYITLAELNKMSDRAIMFNYVVINCKFKFPSGTKYPSIPVYVDDTATVYPLKGSAMLTGVEYVLARNQGCGFEIGEIYIVPFKQGVLVEKREKVVGTFEDCGIGIEEVDTYKKGEGPFERVEGRLESEVITPFGVILKELQEKRREHEKGTTWNMLYKELGNGIYGNVVRGISNKKVLDVRSGLMVRVEGSDISNPIIAS